MSLFSVLEIEMVGSSNIGQFLPHYTVSHLREYYSSYAGIIVPCFKHAVFPNSELAFGYSLHHFFMLTVH
jgi:hypothetical protein